MAKTKATRETTVSFLTCSLICKLTLAGLDDDLTPGASSPEGSKSPLQLPSAGVAAVAAPVSNGGGAGPKQANILGDIFAISDVAVSAPAAAAGAAPTEDEVETRACGTVRVVVVTLSVLADADA